MAVNNIGVTTYQPVRWCQPIARRTVVLLTPYDPHGQLGSLVLAKSLGSHAAMVAAYIARTLRLTLLVTLTSFQTASKALSRNE